MTNILKDGIQSSSLDEFQSPQALILSPTRELCMQIFNESKKFGYGSMIKSGILYGGVDTRHQLSMLDKGCNILVATPGRLLAMIEQQKIRLDKVQYFVLDEADRMLDMGFEKSVREILLNGKIQEKGKRSTFMFSATFPTEIQQLAQDFLDNYLFVTVGMLGGANTDVEQTLIKVGKFDKRPKLVEILNEVGDERVMVFVQTKKAADVLGFYLCDQQYPTTTIHGDREQRQREEALHSFKTGKTKIIVATSVAARGLDIENINTVINYDMPNEIDEYVHRIGRTGRCGNLGKAISFVDPSNENDIKLARPLSRILTQANQTLPDWLSELAEDQVGSAFGGSACVDDVRDKMGSMQLKSTAPVEDEEW